MFNLVLPTLLSIILLNNNDKVNALDDSNSIINIVENDNYEKIQDIYLTFKNLNENSVGKNERLNKNLNKNDYLSMDHELFEANVFTNLKNVIDSSIQNRTTKAKYFHLFEKILSSILKIDYFYKNFDKSIKSAVRIAVKNNTDIKNQLDFNILKINDMLTNLDRLMQVWVFYFFKE